MKRIAMIAALSALVGVVPVFSPTLAADKPNQVLITNIDVWDGRADAVSKGVDVLIEGNLVKQVGKNIQAPDAYKVDGQGGTVMPGMIDMHAHHAIHEGMLEGRNSYDQMAIGAISGLRLREYLDQGFTSSRDAGGNVLGLAKAQQVKNAVIVPVGAKGGFYPKRLPVGGSRDAAILDAGS